MLVSALAILLNSNPISTPIMQGYIGLALFFLVMIASSLKPKSNIRKKLMGLRKHYSVLGFITITPHALYYFFDFLFNDGVFTPFGILAYLIMIPLFITSFITIRKKMKPKHWKNLQRLAYISYFLLLIHLLLHYTQRLNLMAFIALALVYSVIKLKHLLKKRLPKLKKA